MKNLHWIVIGFVVGAGCGALFGIDYAMAGAAIGAAGGGAIFLVMRRL